MVSEYAPGRGGRVPSLLDAERHGLAWTISGVRWDRAMSRHNYEIREGFILRLGRLRKVAGRELAAATHLIGGFKIGNTPDGRMLGSVVWFRGNVRGVKVSGEGVELGPELLGTEPRGFWSRLEDDLKRTMRIDRQKYVNEDGKRFCVYHIQIGDESISCVLVRVNTDVGAGVMRRALTLSLET